MAQNDSDLYFKNTQLNKYVGGDPLLKPNPNYINTQTKTLREQNPKLYPPLRYGNPNNKYDTYDNITNTNTPQFGNNNDTSCCGITNTDFSQFTPTKKSNSKTYDKDTYLLDSKYEYDPYYGYIYDKGLYPDPSQRRRFIPNYVDINSINRIQSTTINVANEYQLLSNPLMFTNGSKIMHINIDPTPFNINDPITLTNVVSKYVVLRTIRGTVNNIQLPTFELIPGYNFMKIWYNHHVPLSYSRKTIEINISGVVGTETLINNTSTFIGNVPVSTINTTHIFYITVTQDDLNSFPLITNITDIDPTYFDPSPNYFFIVLPIALQLPMSSTLTLTDILINHTLPYTMPDYNFNILFNSIEAIPLNLINTSAQITPNKLKSFHVIQSIDNTGINIELSLTAITDTDAQNNDTVTIMAGGNFIVLGHVSRITTGYPDPNNYKISLPEIYHNVVSIKLVSSEIPNANKTIRDYPPESANNKLYWNDIDSGDYVYSIAVPAGNYTPEDLIATFTQLFAATPRINLSPTATYTSTHFIQTAINLNTSEVTFTPYKEFLVQNPIISVTPPIPTDPNIGVIGGVTYYLTIHQENHGITQVGTAILIQNAQSYLGIPSGTINGTHVVTEIIDLNNYVISLPKFTLDSIRTDTGGGVNVFIYVPDIVRFRFDQPDTLGTVLGFRRPGDLLSITPYSTVISNAKPYDLELDTNILGQTIKITNNALQMAGDNYMIMVADPVRVYESTTAIKNAFAKISLCDSPGKVLFNSIVSMTQLYENPISTLDELSIAFYTPTGALVNFDGLEHSFTLEIVTVTDIPKDTRINANTGKNYNQAI